MSYNASQTKKLAGVQRMYEAQEREILKWVQEIRLARMQKGGKEKKQEEET